MYIVERCFTMVPWVSNIWCPRETLKRAFSIYSIKNIYKNQKALDSHILPKGSKIVGFKIDERKLEKHCESALLEGLPKEYLQWLMHKLFSLNAVNRILIFNLRP
jgi:hypothetical protein